MIEYKIDGTDAWNIEYATADQRMITLQVLSRGLYEVRISIIPLIVTSVPTTVPIPDQNVIIWHVVESFADSFLVRWIWPTEIPVAGFMIEYKIDGTDAWNIQYAMADQRMITLQGLIRGLYEVRISVIPLIATSVPTTVPMLDQNVIIYEVWLMSFADSLLVRWTWSTDFPVAGFMIEYKLDGTDAWNIEFATADQRMITLQGLTRGLYNVRISIVPLITTTVTTTISIPVECAEDEFKCAEGHQCIPAVLRCDYSTDCADNSDEVDGCVCDPSSDFECTDGGCIAMIWKCNGEPDCFDGSDEATDLCLLTTPTPTMTMTMELSTSPDQNDIIYEGRLAAFANSLVVRWIWPTDFPVAGFMIEYKLDGTDAWNIAYATADQRMITLQVLRRRFYEIRVSIIPLITTTVTTTAPLPGV
ncbi:uncharacterized protein [Amphiura filiformis]|uniref:uncharacterized protein n=1 Tax=Amphiura filiformis TaxID=82378 RepID=UPI003B21CF05